MIPYSCRFVTVNSDTDASSSSRIRVNIVYERDLRRSQMHHRREETPPPTLELEGYLSVPPAWAGEEVEVKEEPFRKALLNSRKFLQPTLFTQRTLPIPTLSSSANIRSVKAEEQFFVLPIQDVPGEYEGPSHYEYYEDRENELFVLEDNTRSRSAITQTICNICNMQVQSVKRKQHIYTKHLGKPLYKCPLCSYTSVFHKGNVVVHIRRKHRSAMSPLYLKNRYADEISQWMYRCFHDVRIFRCVDQDVVSVMHNLLNWVEEGRQEIPASSNPVDFIENSSSSSPYLKEPYRRLRSSCTCRLCGRTKIQHLERHVLQYHIRQPMFFCPFCTYSSNYSASSVKEHIKARHSLTERAEPVDTRDDNWRQIRLVYDQCFIGEEENKRVDIINIKTRQ